MVILSDLTRLLLFQVFVSYCLSLTAVSGITAFVVLNSLNAGPDFCYVSKQRTVPGRSTFAIHSSPLLLAFIPDPFSVFSEYTETDIPTLAEGKAGDIASVASEKSELGIWGELRFKFWRLHAA